jgi:hypothetical protein
MHHRIERNLFPLLRIQCVGYGFIIPLASPWQPRYQRKKQKSQPGRKNWVLKKEGVKQSGVFLFPVRVNRPLCATLPWKILMYSIPPRYTVPCAPHVFVVIVSLEDFVIVSHRNSSFRGILVSDALFLKPLTGVNTQTWASGWRKDEYIQCTDSKISDVILTVHRH